MMLKLAWNKAIFSLLWFGLITNVVAHKMNKLPSGFVYLPAVVPNIIVDMKYYTADNFIGRPVTGYTAPKCILTEQAAQALAQVAQFFQAQGLALKVFDCYRPQMAVDDFIAWTKDEADQTTKAKYYPNVNKADFFKLNYIAAPSSHSRGSTVDLTLVNLVDGKELAMGTPFDFFDLLSHPENVTIEKQAYKNRWLLRNAMLQAGFAPIATEWWHFTLNNEPHPTTYFNFPIA